MTPEEIKIRLIQKGIRQTDLADRWRRPRSIVSRLIAGQIKTRSLQAKLARALGVKLVDLQNGTDGQPSS